MRKAHDKGEKATKCSDKKSRAGVSPTFFIGFFSKLRHTLTTPTNAFTTAESVRETIGSGKLFFFL